MIDLLKSAMSLTFQRATANKQLWKRSAFLFAAHLVAGSGGPATATLYDGHTTNGNPMVDLSAPTSSTDRRNFNPPIYFDQGIYLVVGSNVTSVLVQLRHAKDLPKATTKKGKTHDPK